MYVVIQRISSYASHFPDLKLSTDDHLLLPWLRVISTMYQDVYLHSMSTVYVSDRLGVLTEHTVEKPDAYIQELQCVVAYNGDVYDMVFRAPVDKFEYYRPLFEAMIHSFSLL